MKHWMLACLFGLACLSSAGQTLRVGAKHFNEGYILSEIIAQLLEHNGYTVQRQYNLGGTLVCFDALRNHEIDVYPEYTGTLSAEILKLDRTTPFDTLRKILEREHNLSITEPYGFNNTYAIIVKRSLALEKHLHAISDLRGHPDLRVGVSYEFLKRSDGWDNLARTYRLPQQAVGLEHGLAYQALAQNKIEVTDAYSTDGEIPRYDLVVLKDTLKFFPAYEATSLYHREIPEKAKAIISQLSGKFTAERMQQMNAEVLYKGKAFEVVATEFLFEQKLVAEKVVSHDSDMAFDILAKTFTHLKLTFMALVLAIFFALPLGIALYWNTSASTPVLYVAGLLQTIPSIALLAIMIPLFGIGPTPAIVALFLYALLPILRNTVVGLQSVDPLLKKVGTGIGMSRLQRLKMVDFPLAIPTILTGIRTAAVINVGTATLAAFIGAGGLGEYIVTGLALNNTHLILRGAIPAALLALLIEIAFELIERAVVPQHLRRS